MASLLEDYEEGFLDPRDLDDDKMEELIGEMAEAAQAWVPLCPVYPRLKGVECDVVDDYTNAVKEHHWICGPIKEEWAFRLEDLMRLSLEDLKEELRPSKEFQDWYGWQTRTGWLSEDREGRRPHWLPESIDLQTIDPMDLWIHMSQDHYGELKEEHNKNRWEEELKAYMIIHLDDGMLDLRRRAANYNYDSRFQCKLGLDASDHPYMSYQTHSFLDDARNYEEAYNDLTEREYWDSVRVYSRDEMFDLAKSIGRQLTGGYDMDLETYREYRVKKARLDEPDWNEVDYDKLREEAANDARWQYFKRTTNYTFERKHVAEGLGVDDVLADKRTIFVTTPRGGLEFLGIFAYANNLEKAQIPAFYEPYEKVTSPHFYKEGDLGRMVGKTWLENRSEPIKRVVIIDDTIDSGEQQLKAHRNLLDFFGPDVEIVHMAACGRRRPDRVYYNEGFHKSGDERLFEKLVHEQVQDCSEGYCPAEPGEANIFDDAYLGVETYNLTQWRREQDDNAASRRGGFSKNAVPTCAFPWSISDATPAAYLREVYGTRWERGSSRRPRRRPL
jgi:adenine/guanine phosphoribosyltransferase-like PRPP-binding protein